MLRYLYVEHGEEQHIRGNSNLNVERTHSVHVKVEIEQGSRPGLGLGLDANKEDLIKNKKLKNRRTFKFDCKSNTFGTCQSRDKIRSRFKIKAKIRCKEGRSD